MVTKGYYRLLEVTTGYLVSSRTCDSDRLSEELSNPVVTLSNRDAQASRRNHSPGFTLMELLVVVAIIALMTTVITVSTTASRAQARDAKRKADLASVAAALEVYFSEERSYPASSAAFSWTALRDWRAAPAKPSFYPTYLTQWPVDRASGDGTFGQGFVYRTNSQNLPAGSTANTLYVLDATLEGNEAVTNADIRCDDPTAANFYLSGTVSCGSTIHYRIASPR